MPVKTSNFYTNNSDQDAWTSRNQKQSSRLGAVIVVIESTTCRCGFRIMETNKRLYKMKMRLHKKTCSLASHESKSK